MKGQSLNSVILDLENKRNQIDDAIRMLRKLYGKEVLEGEFEEVKKQAKVVVQRTDGKETLNSAIRRIMGDGQPRRAADVIRDAGNPKFKVQSILAGLNKMMFDGELKRVDKGVYQLARRVH